MCDKKDGDKLLKIMLVDDEEFCLDELTKILSAMDGIEITGAYTNSTDGLKSAIRDGPDVAFIDVELRGISGLDLAAMLKIQYKGMRVVLMSEKECFARNGFDIGVDDYVLKPLQRERVLKALDRGF